MIRINDDWVIDVDEHNYILQKDMHKSRIRTRRNGAEYEENVYDVKGYFGSLDKALKRLREEMVKEQLITSAHTLDTAVRAIRECTKKWESMCERIWEGQ